MSFVITNATDVFADDTRGVLLAAANTKRRVINIWAGDSDLWFGNRSVKGGTIGNKVDAGSKVELTLRGDIYVIRNTGDAGLCSFSEEINAGGSDGGI